MKFRHLIIGSLFGLPLWLCAGVPAGPQRHHSQSAAGSAALEGYHTQMGSPHRTQASHMTTLTSAPKGSGLSFAEITVA